MKKIVYVVKDRISGEKIIISPVKTSDGKFYIKNQKGYLVVNKKFQDLEEIEKYLTDNFSKGE